MLEIQYDEVPVSDSAAEQLSKQYLDERHYDKHIIGGREGEDTVVWKPDGQPLLVYLRCPPEVQQPLRDAVPALRQAATRSEQQQAASGVVGFMERSRKKRYCRTTRFSRDHPDSWEALLPLFAALDTVYARILPERYALQRAFAKMTSPDYVIPGTCFTTGTVNNAHRFKCHRHRNNLANGMGVMTVWRSGNLQGAFLVFPQWDTAVAMQCGDVLLFDTLDWHGNSAFISNGPFERISLVAYFRRGMLHCGSAQEEVEKAQRMTRF